MGLALVDGIGNMVEAGCSEAYARLVGWCPAIVARCRQLRFVSQPCQMQGSATVNTGASYANARPLTGPVKPQLSCQITQPLS